MSRDIRLDVDFLSNLKTRKLLRELGDHGIVCLIRLWSYVAIRHPKGTMNGMSEDDIEDMSGWTGERGIFASYAVRMRWVDKAQDGHLSIHGWPEHQPWVFHADKRSEAARTAASAKWEKYKKHGVNARRMHAAEKRIAGGNAPSPIPSPSPKDQNQDRKVTRAKPARFTPPTIEEIQEYCARRQSSVDPVAFHAKHTANGWKVGKNPMKNWKATVVYWERISREGR